MTTKSTRVGAVSVCSHNNWQPSAEPCPACTAFFESAHVATMRIYANELPRLDSPYSETREQWYCVRCRTIHVFEPGEPRVCGVCQKH